MTKGTLLILSVIATMLLSCGGSKDFVISKDFKGKRFTANSLGIVLSSPLHLSASEDVVDDLGSGIPEEVYLSFFHSQLPSSVKAKARFEEVSFVDSVDVIEQTLDLSKKEKIAMKLPGKGQIVKSDDQTRNVILFIQDLFIYRQNKILSGAVVPTTNNLNFGVVPASSSRVLIHAGKFALWDNVKGRIISYGKFEAEAWVFFTTTRKTWLNAVDNLVEAIMTKSPFSKQIN